MIKASFGRRLAVLGPLENADLVGTDLTLAIHRTVLPEIDSRPAPSPYLEKLVEQGKLGMKTGEGFGNGRRRSRHPCGPGSSIISNRRARKTPEFQNGMHLTKGGMQ